MEYVHYDHPQPESTFPGADSIHQIPPTFPMDHSQLYHPLDGAAIDSNYGPYDERHAYHGFGMANADDGIDAAKGPRLTQEQLGHLEGEFARHYKPSTEHKKALADSMGVEYAKVNNWFQNRRAKAKHECQAQQRSDRSLQETTLAFGPVSMDYRRIPESQASAYFSSPEQVPIMSDEMGADLQCLNEMSQQCYAPHAIMPMTQSLDMSARVQTDLSNSIIPAPYAQWSADGLYDDNKMPTPTVQEIEPLGILSTSPQLHSSYTDHGPGNLEWHNPPMYQNILGGNFIGNPSLQSFGTSASEDSEQTKLITPPQEASPHPGFNQRPFQHDRQASNSSDLAENLDTVHIQPSQADLSLNMSCIDVSAPDGNTNTGLHTPEVSPDALIPKHGLLSRRKGPRPAALQPESNRSVSDVGPMTSPRFRISSPTSGKPSPVRRIKSTGNGLNVMTGRVKKAGTTTAQLSPRNLESCFKVASRSESQPNADNPAHSRQVSEANSISLAAPSPQAFSKRQGTWPESPKIAVPSSSWDHGVPGNIPYHPSHPEAGWAPNQPDQANLNMRIHPPQPTHHLQYLYPCPPQSAPSHMTSFDPALMPEPLGSNWSTSSIQPEPYRDDTRLSMPFRPNHLQHHSHSGPLNYYQSSVPPFQTYAPSLGGFLSFPPQFSTRTPTPPHKSLDIKVETGPPPPKEMRQSSQERKEYTFENSFPNDPHFATGSKK